MKKILISTALLSLFVFACNKEEDPAPSTPADTTAPVITLNGNANDTVVLNSTYVDAGASAADNVDGNISANIVVSGNLNMNQAGDYTRKYNVMDAAGNAATEVSRNIHVRNEAWFLAGNYAASPNCGLTPVSNYNTSISVSQTVNRSFSFSSLQGNFTGQTPEGSLQAGNTTFTVNQISGNGAQFSGSGQIIANGKLTLSSYVRQPGVIFGYYCTTTLTPQ